MIGLLSFFELHKVDYFIEATDGFFLNYLSDIYFTNEFRQKRLIHIEGEHCLNLWAYHRKKLIEDETNGYAMDNHAGLFAQREWAEKLKGTLAEEFKKKYFMTMNQVLYYRSYPNDKIKFGVLDKTNPDGSDLKYDFTVKAIV